MNTLLRILSLILIVMSLVLLLADPLFGFIGILIGCFLFWFASKIKTEIKTEKQISEEDIEERRMRIKEKAEQEKVKRSEYLRAVSANPVFIDTETTGLHPDKNDELLSLAIISKDGTVLFDKMFKPEHRRRWDEAEAINGISPSMVKKCPPFADYIKDVEDILNASSGVVGYNVNFDLNFLDNAGVIYNGPTVDAMEMYSSFVGNPDQRYKLRTAAKRCGYKWSDEDAHSSVYDAQATRYVFATILKQTEGIEI